MTSTKHQGWNCTLADGQAVARHSGALSRDDIKRPTVSVLADPAKLVDTLDAQTGNERCHSPNATAAGGGFWNAPNDEFLIAGALAFMLLKI